MLPRTIFSHSKSRAHQHSWSQRTSPRTTSWCVWTRCWTTCLKPCSDSQGKQCYRFCQQIPIWQNGIIRPVPSAACVALQIRRTSMFSQIALLPWTVILFDTTTFSCCSPSVIQGTKPSNSTLCVDIDGATTFQPIDQVFQSVIRPDLVLYDASKVCCAVNCTICHESNILKSRSYKVNKYSDIKPHLNPSFLVITFNCTQLKFQF